MKVAVVQLGPRLGDVSGNVEKILGMISSEDADLFVLPELALSGYMLESTKEAMSLAQTPDASEFDRVEEMAREKEAAIVLGFAEKAGDCVFNAALLVRPDGSRFVYRKIQLFWGEKRIFRPGDRPPEVIDVAGVRLGMMICFDWIFPEVARSLALQGADILCHSANLVLPHCQDAMVTRCLENRVFAAIANRVGSEERSGEKLEFTGLSEIVAPDGRILGRASRDGEEILVVELDPTDARSKEITPLNDVLGDRRPELYRL